MPLLPIPLRWRAAACDHCGESVRHISLGRNTVTLNPRPVSVLAERFGDAGAVTAYEHRVGYEAHHCTSAGRGANTELPDNDELSRTRNAHAAMRADKTASLRLLVQPPGDPGASLQS